MFPIFIGMTRNSTDRLEGSVRVPARIVEPRAGKREIVASSAVSNPIVEKEISVNNCNFRDAFVSLISDKKARKKSRIFAEIVYFGENAGCTRVWVLNN